MRTRTSGITLFIISTVLSNVAFTLRYAESASIRPKASDVREMSSTPASSIRSPPTPIICTSGHLLLSAFARSEPYNSPELSPVIIIIVFIFIGIDNEEPCGRDRRASEIEYLFSVSFPLVGNPSDCSGSQERFWTSQNDRNKELRQRPQGVQFIKLNSGIKCISRL